MKKVRVNLQERSYEVIVGGNILKYLSPAIKKFRPSSVIVLTDTNVSKLYESTIKKAVKPFKPIFIVIPSGEEHKNLPTASSIYDQILKHNCGRDSVLIALGGGVVGDIGGYIASTYMRGIHLIHIPTTLLAQVDSAIGGKTGLDHSSGKNLIGSFYQPKLVLCDLNFLKTLPQKEVQTGFAEIIKYGVIKDSNIFDILESSEGEKVTGLEEIIARCAAIKSEVVARDEREETGLRMILNFGHTFGHAIESLTCYKRYTHGQAVAIGMAAGAFLANATKLLKREDFDRTIALIEKYKLPIKTDLKCKDLLKLMSYDKKAKNGRLRFILPIQIGKVIVKDNIPNKHILKALNFIGCK